MVREEQDWWRFEVSVAMWFGGEHTGNRRTEKSNADGTRERFLGFLRDHQIEAKYWSGQMNQSEVLTELKKGRTILVSYNGFTLGAIEAVRRRNLHYLPSIELYQWPDWPAGGPTAVF